MTMMKAEVKIPVPCTLCHRMISTTKDELEKRAKAGNVVVCGVCMWNLHKRYKEFKGGGP